MGIKRTQDSGRRDALGREIKVSGHQVQRASGSGVDGGEQGARSDFASQPGSSSEHSLDSLSEALGRIEDARNAEALRAQGARHDIEMMEWDAMREQAHSLIAEFDERGDEALRDPKFLAAVLLIDSRNDDEALDEGDPSDLLYPVFAALNQDGGETYYRPYTGSLFIKSLHVDDETLRKEAQEMDEINDLQRQVVDIASSIGDPRYVKDRLNRTDEGMSVCVGFDAADGDYALEALDDGRYEVLDAENDRSSHYDSMFDALKAMRDGL